jgi:hypothetical protein
MKILITLAIFLSITAHADWIKCPQVKSQHTFRIDQYVDNDLFEKGWNHDGNSSEFYLYVEKAEITGGKMVCMYSPAPGFKVLHSYTKELPADKICRLHDNKRSFVCFNKPN